MIDRVRLGSGRAKSHAGLAQYFFPALERFPRCSARQPELPAVVVIIPALNEEQSLPLVLADLPPEIEVLVVDNGSTDSTSDVAERGGATVLYEPCRGYGSACQRGLDHVDQSIRAGCLAPRVVAFLDADYSDHPELLPQLVEPILDGRAELVLGSRVLGVREAGAMPPQAVFGNRLACLLMWLFFGANYTDLGPFRAIEYSALKRLDRCATAGSAGPSKCKSRRHDEGCASSSCRFHIGGVLATAKSAAHCWAAFARVARFSI